MVKHFPCGGSNNRNGVKVVVESINKVRIMDHMIFFPFDGSEVDIPNIFLFSHTIATKSHYN